MGSDVFLLSLAKIAIPWGMRVSDMDVIYESIFEDQFCNIYAVS